LLKGLILGIICSEIKKRENLYMFKVGDKVTSSYTGTKVIGVVAKIRETSASFPVVVRWDNNTANTYTLEGREHTYFPHPYISLWEDENLIVKSYDDFLLYKLGNTTSIIHWRDIDTYSIGYCNGNQVPMGVSEAIAHRFDTYGDIEI
jgi:hypothetical protein